MNKLQGLVQVKKKSKSKSHTIFAKKQTIASETQLREIQIA